MASLVVSTRKGLVADSTDDERVSRAMLYEQYLIGGDIHETVQYRYLKGP